MATNSFFNNYNRFSEQGLIEDLVVESIKMYGIDMYYITRKYENVDNILNEDGTSSFDTANIVEMYVKTNDSFGGQGDFFSKFGLTMKDQIVFSMSRRSFEQNILSLKPEIKRPREGDVIFFPIVKKFFDITHVEHESVFYQTGALQVFDITCELLEFSNERFQTGVPLIDSHIDHLRTDNVTTLEDLKDVLPNAKNFYFEQEIESMIDEQDFDPFKEIITYPTKD